MAKLEFKQTIDVLSTLKTFGVLESLKLREEDVKKQSFRTMMYNYLRDGSLSGRFNVVSLSNEEYVVTRTA